MGFFSSKKKVYVSSVVYNLAGDVNERPNYLKSLVLGSVLNNAPSMAESVVNGYLSGPGLQLRRFSDWADDGYRDAIGMVAPTITSGAGIPLGAVDDHIPIGLGETALVQTAQIGNADYSFWVDKYLLDTHPEAFLLEYTADYNGVTGVVTVRIDRGGVYTFTPVGYNPNSRYLYAGYVLTKGATLGPVVEDSQVTVPGGGVYPSTSGWSLVADSSVNELMLLARKVTNVVTYSDSRPSETTEVNTSTAVPYIAVNRVYDKTTYIGAGTDGKIRSSIEWMVQLSHAAKSFTTTTNTVTVPIDGGVNKTTTTTTIQDTFSLVLQYQLAKQINTHETQSNIKIFIYEYGTGNPTLDALFAVEQSIGKFYPHIPIRIDNKFVSQANNPTVYPLAKKAFKRAIKGDLDSLIDKVSDNPSLGDIDYAYIVFGVSLNVKENSCKRYLYEFFNNVYSNYALSSFAVYTAWKNAWAIADAQAIVWANWRAVQQSGYSGNPLFGTPEPTKPYYPALSSNKIRIGSAATSIMNYDVTVSWQYMIKDSGVGIKVAGTRAGDYTLESGGTEVFNGTFWVNDQDNQYMITAEQERISTTYVIYQETDNIWHRVNIGGLKYRNLIYKGKSVDIDAVAALSDPEESGFIIPLNDTIYRATGLKDSTQMSTACCFVIFNCYQEVKKKWYQTGIFKLLMVIVIAAVSIVFPPASGVSGGVLGASAGVGAALGFTGIAALIVGAVANAVAAMVLTSIITSGAKALLGDKIGSLVGAIASFVAIAYGSGYFDGKSFSEAFLSLGNAKDLLKLTGALANGYSQMVQAQAQEYIQLGMDYAQEYKEQMGDITEQFGNIYGTDTAYLDPTRLISAVGSFDQAMEPVNTFLGRTLLTGSEVADMTHKFISEFASITLQNSLP